MEPSNLDCILMTIWMVALILGIFQLGNYFERKEKERRALWEEEWRY